MKIYSKQSVVEAAEERIRYLFDEFDNISVSVSGGKDSEVLFHMVYKIAQERKQEITVVWIDQEAEWTFTGEQVKKMMYLPGVRPLWFQMPIKIPNATSNTTPFLECWYPDQKWLRERDPISIKENITGATEWGELFEAIAKTYFPTGTTAFISGVRTEESPRRHMGLTNAATYKWITWGNVMNKKLGHYTFYPIYDWSYTDVWAYIHKNGIKYNKVYDFQYRYGVPITKMRVSNLHHETAVHALFYLPEVDPQLYNKLVERLPGVATANRLNTQDYFITKLPFMFASWYEYRDFLVDKLASGIKDMKAKLQADAKLFDETFADNEEEKEKAARVIINALMCNDFDYTKVRNHKVVVDRINRIKKGTWSKV